jgi:hypothetical protein
LPASPPSCALTIQPADRNTAKAAALVDRIADYEIPSRLWSTWKPENGRRGVVRTLAPEERAAVERRAADLDACCQPFGPHEQDRAIAAVSSMLGGFRNMRQDDEAAAAVLDGLRRVLASFPLWAIEQGCLLIQGGNAIINGKQQDRRWPPNDSEIFGVIDGIVQPYRGALERAMALLNAPVERPPRGGAGT